MRAVIQRVSHASVTVDGQIIGQIGMGLMVLLGCAQGDTEKDLEYVLEKLLNLRIFEDAQGKMNDSLIDVGGQLLVVSQFTLCADVRKGRRPSFMGAMRPELAEPMIERFIENARVAHPDLVVQTGRFGATMDVALTNHGPVTIIIDSDHLSP